MNSDTSASSPGLPVYGILSTINVPVLAFIADNYYAMPLGAAIASIAANFAGDTKLQTFIVDAGVSQTNKEKLLRSIDGNRVVVQWLHPSGAQKKLLQSLPCGYVGRPTYYKLLLPELLGPEYPRIIYLDCDVIVEADISPLWNIDIGDNHVLAVQDLINPYVSSRFGLRNWRSLGRMPGDELFNTGVLVFNAEKWHKENALRCLLQYLRDNRKFIQLCDQDAMNAVFHSTRGKLDPRWNVLQYIPLASRYSLLDKPSHEALLRNAYILHFCGPNKPWHSTRPCAYSDRFFHYLRLTAWRDWHPSKRMFNTHALSYYGRRAASLVRRFC
ncbi:MAG TPA: glycosyltransferase family 8 protein [Syntrophorhabdaceae bacterium]|nr:glycosyltransferase family 8 protein [Syntrophorhabdaceae bacterium]